MSAAMKRHFNKVLLNWREHLKEEIHMWKQNFVPARRNYAIKNQAAQHAPLPSRGPATRRAYTADVLSVLREEAELETKLRH